MKKPKRLGKMGTIKTIGSLKRRVAPSSKAARPSTVESHAYDPETGHLTVTFHGGRQYRYEGVDKATAQGFRKADSQGGYLHRHVIGKFSATKIG